MFYLIIAITFGSLFAILFKLFQRNGIDVLQAIGINYIVALLLGFIGNIAIGEPLVAISSWILPALFAGLFMMGGFVMMNRATHSHGIAVATIAARISFVIPVLCSYCFLQGEAPRWGASAFVILALLFIFFHHKKQHKHAIWQWLFPLSVFFCYGIANFLLKLCQQFVTDAHGGNADLSMITSIAFFAAFIYTVIYYRLQPSNQRHPFAWKNIWAGGILGSVNVGCTYFLLKALTNIDSSLFYPIYNMSIVLIATLVGQFCFKETLSRIQYIGIAIALLAIALFFYH